MSIAISELQKEILYLIKKGKSETEISQIIHKSKDTVKYHKKVIIRKLGVSNINQAIIKAIKEKVIEL